jgi:hypothetical protein
MEPTSVFLTGIQAAGKSTVGRLLAQRLGHAAFIEGDDLWRMVVSGREDMAEPPSAGALAQLRLRYEHGALLSRSFVAHGFSAVHVDNAYGPVVTEILDQLPGRRALVVLRPTPESVAEREAARGTGAYRDWLTRGTLLDAVRQFDSWLGETPPLGLWVDSTHQTPEQTVDWILEHWDTAIVDR